MKALFSRFTLASTIVLTFALFCLAGCNLFGEENPDCGARDTHSRTITYEMLKASSQLVNEGNNREYAYTFTLNDMCALEHIHVTWRAYNDDTEAWFSRFRADVFWFFLYQQEVNLNYVDIGRYVAFQEVGLKDAFGDEPAWAIFTFYANFPTKGSQSADDDYLETIFRLAEVEVEFYYPLSE